MCIVVSMKTTTLNSRYDQEITNLIAIAKKRFLFVKTCILIYWFLQIILSGNIIAHLATWYHSALPKILLSESPKDLIFCRHNWKCAAICGGEFLKH